MIFNNNTIKISSIIIVLILILIPSFYVPMHSDDFGYELKGNSLSVHINYYLQWSGRFVADYVSTTLLSLNYYVRAIINSIAFTLLILFISLIPVVADKKNKGIWEGFNPIIFFLLFILYWIVNPKLGETSFWIVGSANYMWTNLFIVIFFFLLFYNIKKKDISFIDKVILIFFSLLAGCSNETGLSVVFITFILLLYIKEKKKIVLCSFIGNVVGYLVLILAPGNYKRVQLMPQWYSRSLFERIRIQFSQELPKALDIYIIVFFISLFISINFFLFYLRKKKKDISKYSFLAFIFLVGAVLAILILIGGAPGIAHRALNAPLVLLLIASSFIFFIINKTGFTRINTAILILVACIFIFSYLYFFNAIYYTKKQDDIRKTIIVKAKANNNKTVSIPKFYFTHLWKETDKFDEFFSGKAMGTYYGMERIFEYPSYFNYSKDLQKEKYINVDWDMGKGIVIDRVIIFKDAPFKFTLFFRMDNDYFNKLPENMGLYFHEYNYINKVKNVSRQWESIFKYNNYFYKFIEVSSNLNKIQVGIYIYNKETDSYKNINIHELNGDFLRTTLKK